VDANIATVIRARDELEEDNKRLRQTLSEERKQRSEDEARHATDRARWLFDQERYRADIARLEAQIRVERDDAAARYDALLETVHKLRLRADTQQINEAEDNI
jgi:gamma-glutamyl:cysteine ligase YbdK (ATP-grasp superfamily)